MIEPRKVYGLTFVKWLEEAGFEQNSTTMWPEDYEALQLEWEAGHDPYEYIGSKTRPVERDPEDM